MRQKFRKWCTGEIWRLLWLMGAMFLVIIIFQRFELPYGNILSAISSAQKDLEARNSSLLTDGETSKLETVSNSTGSNGMISSGSSNEASDGGNKKNGKEMDADKTDDILSRDWDKTFEIDQNEQDSLSERLEDSPTNLTMDQLNSLVNGSSPEETEQRFPTEQVASLSENSGTSGGATASIVPAAPPAYSPSNITFTGNAESRIVATEAHLDPRRSAPSLSNDGESGELPNNMTRLPALLPRDSPPNITFTSSAESNTVAQGAPVDPKTVTPGLSSNGKTGEQAYNTTTLHGHSSATAVPKIKRMPEKPKPSVLSISDMNNLLFQRWASPHSVRPRWDSEADRELLNVKSLIKNAPIVKDDPILYAPLYHNLSTFKRSYELMEDTLKVYIYKEGEKPMVHQPVLQGIYASEGWFMRLMEANKRFVTKNPKKAHLFYLPFSSRNLELQLYVPDSHNRKAILQYLRNYLGLIVERYPFWNRTSGADHFLVACHDWAPSETRRLMANCIRALCNNDVKEGFVFGKDVSLPESMVINPRNPLRDLGGKPPSKRSILAFFAGSMHGYLRPILLQHWENKDPDMKIFGPIPKLKGRRKMNYPQYMKSSKYCICAKGYEVNSPRVVEAIFYECVPVILSDNFVPPFFEVLNWESFAVFVMEKDIPDLKNILLSIPEKRYRQMQMRVRQVQKHFLWHAKPEKYDIFHMILHSVWYNRVFKTSPR